MYFCVDTMQTTTSKLKFMFLQRLDSSKKRAMTTNSVRQSSLLDDISNLSIPTFQLVANIAFKVWKALHVYKWGSPGPRERRRPGTRLYKKKYSIYCIVRI